MPFAATWVDLEMIIVSELSDRERQIPYDITYMWTPKYDANEHICKTETNSHRKQIYVYQRRENTRRGEIT